MGRPFLLRHAIARVALGAVRWKTVGTVPSRGILVGAPHTSNWDFVVGLFCDLALDLDAAWLGKHTIFVGPFGRWLKSLGGIPVERGASHNVVSQVSAEFARRDQMILALAPEGTRRKVSEWKSGYWHIARAAGVPILPVGFDFARRATVIGTARPTTDSLEDDEGEFKRFFAGITPKRPELR